MKANHWLVWVYLFFIFFFVYTELIESTVYLYRATRDPFLLKMGVDMVESIEHVARTKCGYATVRAFIFMY